MTLNTISLNTWTQKAMTLGFNLLAACLILVVGMWVAKRLAGAVERLLTLRKVEKTVVKFVRRLTYYLLMLLVLLAVLAKLNVPTTSLVAILGGMSLAVGLSLKSSLSNLASGFLLILFRPFHLGDYIKVGGISGTVKEINILYTELLSSSQEFMTVPNNIFTKDAVTNFSRNKSRRADIVVGIGYNDDIDKAKALIEGLLQSDDRILTEPVPMVVVKELADSSVNILARFHTSTSNHWSAIYQFNEAVKKTFDANGISIPFPQADVHLYKEQG